MNIRNQFVTVVCFLMDWRSVGIHSWLILQEMKICSAIINLFHLIPAAPQTLVKPLLEVVMKTERAMLIEVTALSAGGAVVFG